MGLGKGFIVHQAFFSSLCMPSLHEFEALALL